MFTVNCTASLSCTISEILPLIYDFRAYVNALQLLQSVDSRTKCTLAHLIPVNLMNSAKLNARIMSGTVSSGARPGASFTYSRQLNA